MSIKMVKGYSPPPTEDGMDYAGYGSVPSSVALMQPVPALSGYGFGDPSTRAEEIGGDDSVYFRTQNAAPRAGAIKGHHVLFAGLAYLLIFGWGARRRRSRR